MASTLRVQGVPTNLELVEQRLATFRAKKDARGRAVQQSNERNQRLKRLLYNTTDSHTVPTLYAIKVSVCDELRQELKLSGREKRGRVFVEQESAAVTSLKALKFELHSFFRALRKSSFILSAGFPVIEEDGTIISSAENATDGFWDVTTDEDVARTFRVADELFAEKRHLLKRPAIVIHVRRDPNAPLPPRPPAYLQSMPDPNQSKSMTMLSFYAFPPEGIADPEDFAQTLRKLWKPFHALGRVYVAQEGVNAQMSVPTNVLEQFRTCCREIRELGTYMENGINIDPKPLTVEDFATAGVPVNGKPAPPFRNLHVRVRNQIVADGLDQSLDWQSAGYDMPPMEWHEKVKEAKTLREEGREEFAPLIIDCRNTYETSVGRFEGAEPLETESFRETWEVLKDRLARTPKDAPIMMYCTGGIRCVKVGAYVTQEMGFTNVSRLAGGIIAYDRKLSEEAKEEEPMFKGTNFVFDGRLGRAITDDTLGSCITCAAETSLVSNCLNDNCHQRMIQCQDCKTAFHGTCSDACRNRVLNGLMSPRRGLVSSGVALESKTDSIVYSSLDDYSMGHSSPTPSIYRELEFNTKALIPTGSHMISGASQGRLLAQLASMSREGRVLELGTFTGYATACLLEGASNAANVIGMTRGNRESGAFVMSMERDQRAFDVAVAQMKILAGSGHGEEASEALCALRNGGLDRIPSNIKKFVRLEYDGGTVGCELFHVTDALATMEEMAAGRGDVQPAPFDLVFVDADKTRLLEYTEACLSSDRVLKKGGFIVVDNVLWKGLVLEASAGHFASMVEDETTEELERRKNRRARKLANKMHRFNSEILRDPRVEVLVLPIRDGLSVIRKK
jgi:UPF0176 protein